VSEPDKTAADAMAQCLRILGALDEDERKRVMASLLTYFDMPQRHPQRIPHGAPSR